MPLVNPLWSALLTLPAGSGSCPKTHSLLCGRRRAGIRVVAGDPPLNCRLAPWAIPPSRSRGMFSSPEVNLHHFAFVGVLLTFGASRPCCQIARRSWCIRWPRLRPALRTGDVRDPYRKGVPDNATREMRGLDRLRQELMPVALPVENVAEHRGKEPVADKLEEL